MTERQGNDLVTRQDCAILHGQVHEAIRELSGSISSVRDEVLENRKESYGIKEEVRALKEHQLAQNGSVNDIKLKMAEQRGALLEREKWEERQAERFQWTLGAGLIGAGLISGIVFGVLGLVVK